MHEFRLEILIVANLAQFQSRACSAGLAAEGEQRLNERTCQVAAPRAPQTAARKNQSSTPRRWRTTADTCTTPLTLTSLLTFTPYLLSTQISIYDKRQL